MSSDRKALTDQTSIEYLLSNNNKQGEKMKGTIRPTPRQRRCPKCSKLFGHILKLGYICSKCKTVPSRFSVDIHWNGARVRIYSDKQGQPLDSYQRALNLLSTIQYEIDIKSFDPSKYVRSDQKKFLTHTLLDMFLKEKEKRIAPSYVVTYKGLVERHKEFFSNTDVREIRKVDLKNYSEHMENIQVIKPKTIKNTMDNFKTFMNWVKNELEMIDVVPFFPNIEVQEYEYTWYDTEDQIKILEYIEEGDRPIIAFLMLHGCRPGEARALKVKHIDIKRQTIKISSTFSGRVIRERRKGRGAKSLIIPIHREMLEYVEERVKNHPEAFVFVNPRTGRYYSDSAFKRVWDKAREKGNFSKKMRCYDATRHSLASQLANSGESVFVISKILGHSSIKMTEKYMHKDVGALKSTLSKMTLKKSDVLKLPKPSTDRLRKDRVGGKVV